jgi:tetraacyldisaccharide 4'-kinase
MNRAATFALTPLSLAYSLGVRLRNRLYRDGRLKIHDVGVPVISVGNLTTGGTGKTPLVKWLATQMSLSGQRVCILTRGYGRKSSGRIVVSDYATVLANVHEAGDEPFLLARELQGRAAVICDANRVAAAEWAVAHLSSKCFILDDAFQHQRIKRDFNILTIDATNPWGNGRLLPSGILREPISQLTRADCILITRADDPETTERVRAEIREHVNNRPVFTSRIKVVQPRSLTDGPSANFSADESRVAAFCGIGNPDSFFSLLRQNKYDVAYTRAFRDHHEYTQSDVNRFVTEANSRGAKFILTTAKDAVKLNDLKFDLPCLVIDAEIEIDDEAQLLAHIHQAIGKTLD